MPSGGAEALNVEEILAVMGNPIKRRIVEVIAERGEASFTDLRKCLNISVGALYYNLDGLKEYVTRNDERKYVLTEKGHLLYRAMREGQEAVRGALAPRSRLARLLEERVLPYLVPYRLVLAFYGNEVASALVAAACLSAGLLVTMHTRLPLKLLEVEQVPALVATRRIGPFPLSPEAQLLLDFAVSHLAALTVIFLAGRALGGRSQRLLGLLAGVSLAWTPLYLYMLIQYLLTGLSYPNVSEGLMVALGLLFRTLQVASMGLLTAAISVFCGMRVDRSFLVTALLMYLSFAARDFLP